MNQETIRYVDVMNLGFTEELTYDSVHEQIHGYPYKIIQKQLTKKIYVDWYQPTRLCEMIRIDSKKKGNIMNRMPIRSLEHLEEIIDFFTNNE